MVRYVAGGASALLLIAAGFFVWKSGAEAENMVPPAPAAGAASYQAGAGPRLASPPAQPERSREAKRFARADRDRDGRITLAEQLAPRRKAFAKADRDSSGSLSFEEWTVKTAEKFSGADADGSGWLTPKEYEVTKAKTRPKPKCSC